MVVGFSIISLSFVVLHHRTEANLPVYRKHMDKHDRPYKCPAEGCEKLPGFTYSGGLLRHEREVHNKHGGPRKQLNCPHQNCKRHTGKGFSRQENLNEHLRRVHTDTSALEEAGVMNGMGQEQQAVQDLSEGGEPGAKRKRRSTGGAGLSVEDELREENKKLRLEVDSLKRAHQDLIRQISQITGQNHNYLNNLSDPQMQQQATMQVQQAPMQATMQQPQIQNQMAQNNLQQQMPQTQMQQPQIQQPQMQQPMQQLQQAQQAQQVQQAHQQQQQQMPQPPSAQQIVQQIASQQQAQQAAQQAANQAQQQAAQVQQALPQRMPSAPMM